MRGVRMTVEYDGTDFVGWQRQASGRTVQGVIEAAVEEMTSIQTHVQSAGRTDSGVHARGQVASFRTESTIPALGIQRGLNVLLPRDVTIVDAIEVLPEFDARHDARGKRYTYRIWNHETRSSLESRTSWHIRAPLDVTLMNRAAEPLFGEHDFVAFRAADDRENTVVRMRRIAAVRVGSVIEVEVEATHFLKHMVRILVGTLAAVGRGEMRPEAVEAVLRSRDRTRAGVTAPPQGLCLSEVFYAP